MGVGTSEHFSNAGNYIYHGYQHFVQVGRNISWKYFVHECSHVDESFGQFIKQTTVNILLSVSKTYIYNKVKQVCPLARHKSVSKTWNIGLFILN
jgi:hypothetical protein